MKDKSPVVKLLTSTAVIPTSVIIAFLFNYSMLNDLIIGNEEAYDTSHVETGVLFNLFYEISSNTGYHPELSHFNFAFTAIAGLLVGCALSYLLFWRPIKID